MKTFLKKSASLIPYLIVWVLVILYLIPVIRSTRYASLWADDFAAAYSILKQPSDNILVKVLLWTKDMYMTHQGTHTGCLMWGLTSPLVWGRLGIIRLVSIVNSLFIFTSTYYCIYSICKKVGLRVRHAIIFYALFVGILISYRPYQEIFFWHTGQTLFSYPMSFLLVGIGLMLNKPDNKKITTIIACICSFIGMGGHLMITISASYAIFFYIIFDTINSKKITKYNVAFSITSLISSLFAILAPGNFSRASSKTTTFIEAMKYSLNITTHQTQKMFGSEANSGFLFIILAFIMGLLIKETISIKKSLPLIPVLFLWPIITIFSVAWVYDLTQGEINASRFYFSFNYAFFSSFIAIMFILGQYCKILIKKQTILIVLSILIIVPMIPLTIQHTPEREDIIPIAMSDSLKIGQIQELSQKLLDCIDTIRFSVDENVEVNWPGCPYWADVCRFSNDPNGYPNGIMADMYGKKSVIYH